MAAGAPRATDTTADAEAFVRAFAALWDRPTVEGFAALMHPDVRLVQPLAPPARGVAGARAWFAGTLALLPDLRIAVDRWSGTPDALFIEWTATATFAGKALGWSAVDRFQLADGKVLERVAYFDPLPLVGSVARRPAGWLRFVRSRFGARGRAIA
jgi:ketosteroid isomerase-like protein